MKLKKWIFHVEVSFFVRWDLYTVYVVACFTLFLRSMELTIFIVITDNWSCCKVFSFFLELKNTSSDHLIISHLSFEKYCDQVSWSMVKNFYSQRSAISLAFQRYQCFWYHLGSFSSSFHFSDATPSWIWAEFTKSGQSWYFSLVTLCKKFCQTAAWSLFYGANFSNAI